MYGKIVERVKELKADFEFRKTWMVLAFNTKYNVSALSRRRDYLRKECFYTLFEPDYEKTIEFALESIAIIEKICEKKYDKAVKKLIQTEIIPTLEELFISLKTVETLMIKEKGSF